jgi:hypothetical protein
MPRSNISPTFGTLRTLGAGFTWEPIPQVDVIASFTDEDGAPGVQQLGDPNIVTPNVRVFDFTRGETVDVTRIEGGNRTCSRTIAGLQARRNRQAVQRDRSVDHRQLHQDANRQSDRLLPDRHA